jgi:hypothetical protein
MYGALIRLTTGHVAVSYKYDKWAREFITLADEEFKVSERNPTSKKVARSVQVCVSV